MENKILPETEMMNICRKGDGYKDKYLISLILPVKGCEGCWYHGIIIREKKPKE